MDFKPTSTPQNWLVKWDFHPLIYSKLALSLVDVELPTPPSCRDIYISSVRLNINEWSDSGWNNMSNKQQISLGYILTMTLISCKKVDF